MSQVTTDTMRAVVMDQFGGVETLSLRSIPVPQVGPDEILIHVESAGVGVWDTFEREGGFAKLLGIEPKFPYVLGSDGAGLVVDIGAQVSGLKVGDRVYACSLANPKGGFYAEYATAKADNAAPIPGNLTTEQAGVTLVDAITALCGLDTVLALKEGENLLVFGASGGVGHLAVQLAKRMGARVLAVASGDDGVQFVKSLGADLVLEGHKDDLFAAAHEFAPGGLDAALITAGGKAADDALLTVRDGGRVAYPNGVEPAPEGRSELTVQSYDGTPTPQLIAKLNQLIESGPFEVHVAKSFPLEQAADAQRALDEHYLGKLALKPDGAAS